MAFSRAAAFRSCFRGTRPTVVRPQLWRHVARRGYASGGHGSSQAGGDAVWAAGAIAVTVPTCWWLLSNGSDASHGHDTHGASHGKSHKDEGEDEEPEAEEDGDKEAEEKSEDGEEKQDEKESDDGKDADTPDTSDDEDNNVVAVDDKNIKKHTPDAKGGAKKRLDSTKAIKQGDISEVGGDEGGPRDKAASSKPAGSQNTQSGKQEGLSNTDTKHSTDITNDPTKSKKGEGTPESSKAKGTVDPKRPQKESPGDK